MIEQRDSKALSFVKSALDSKSREKTHGAIAKRLCTGLQIHVARFDSGSRLHFRESCDAQESDELVEFEELIKNFE